MFPVMLHPSLFRDSSREVKLPVAVSEYDREISQPAGSRMRSRASTDQSLRTPLCVPQSKLMDHIEREANQSALKEVQALKKQIAAALSKYLRWRPF